MLAMCNEYRETRDQSLSRVLYMYNVSGYPGSTPRVAGSEAQNLCNHLA
jgi:hypothetical protein